MSDPAAAPVEAAPVDTNAAPVDPATGLPVDPAAAMGAAAVDPATGLPLGPDAAAAMGAAPVEAAGAAIGGLDPKQLATVTAATLDTPEMEEAVRKLVDKTTSAGAAQPTGDVAEVTGEQPLGGRRRTKRKSGKKSRKSAKKGGKKHRSSKKSRQSGGKKSRKQRK